MSQFAAAKNPPWVRGTAAAGLTQPPPPGTSITTSILTGQASHAPTAGTALPTGTLATAVVAAAAAQTQQAQPTPAVSASYGTLTLTQPGIAIPASLAATTQVNSGVVVELARLPQPGVALPTSLATTQVATVSYPAPRLLAQTTQFQASQAHAQQTAVVQQAAPQPAPPPQQQQALKQRVFTGTVTKLHENFGFVDEDVFFQISAVKGTLPKAGERVLVEAAYNPNMPFKWNATRIQLLPNQICQVNVQPANNNRSALAQGTAMATTVMTTSLPVGLNLQPSVNISTPVASISNTQAAQFPNVSQQGRWQVQQEMAVIEQIGQPRVSIQYENRLDGPHPWTQDAEYAEIQENKGPRICTVSRRHTSPPPSRRDRERDIRREDSRRDRYRERERYSPPPSRKRSRSPRRPSRSPPRRRPRIVPRCTVQVPKISLDVKEGNVMELRKRYANLYIPSDFCSASFLWQDAFRPHHPFTLDHPCTFHIVNKDCDVVADSETVQEPSDTDHLYSAKVMLLASPPLKEIFKKSCALANDTDETKESFVHSTRLISFLVGLKGKNETVAIGGPWSPSLDGPNPDKDPSVLIRTAIRTCKALTGIDLSKCSQWYRFAEIYYRRGESTHKGRVLPTRVETVILFFPDVWSCLPTRVEWDGMMAGYKKQLLKKLHEDGENPAETQEPEDETEEVEKKEPTHFSELDPRTIKVCDLKRELDARNLSSKGLKSQLIARLTKALKTESEKEQMGDKENGTSDENKMDAEEMNEEDEEKRKELEEKVTKGEKEHVDVEKKLQMPDKPTIVVHPSRTAKGGKFDCTVMSLSLLLDYRQEDNKEHSFEVSLFAELFNEMMMRDFGFRIYRALVEAPDVKDDEKDKDKKKKDDQKYKKDDKDEYRRKEEIDNESDKDEDDSYEEDCEGDERKDRERKRRRKKKVQMYTFDPYLLLACVYYDQTHCGYLLDKDIEEILYTLGLHLSRAQVRKLVQRVCRKEIFRYRKLTDRPVAEGEKRNGVSSPKINLEELAAGNKKYLPVFEPIPSAPTEEESESKETDAQNDQSAHLVSHQGALVDVGKLLEQLERREKSRIEMEQRLKNMEEELDSVNEVAAAKDKHAQKLSLDLEQYQQQLRDTAEELKKAQFQNEKYHRALSVSRNQLHSTLTVMDNVLPVRIPWYSGLLRNNENSWAKGELDLSDGIDFRSFGRDYSSQSERRLSSPMREIIRSNRSSEDSYRDHDFQDSQKPNTSSDDSRRSKEQKTSDSID